MHARKIAEYLAAIERFDRRATTTQIRVETGLTNRQVNYRHDKLAAKGYVDVSNPGADPVTGEPRAKTATLRAEGEFWLDKHRHLVETTRGEVTVTKAKIESFESDIRQLHRRLDVIISMLDEAERARSNALDERMTELEALLDEIQRTQTETVLPFIEDWTGTHESDDDFDDFRV
jgi:hypothetical protein